MTSFDPRDRATWLDLLTGEQVAAIWQISISTLNRRVSEGQFIQPADILGPRRWRKADVVRVLGKVAA